MIDPSSIPMIGLPAYRGPRSALPMAAQHDKIKRSGRSPIETQIHRRKKAKALSPLELEWERADHTMATRLRMPSTLMIPQPKTSKKNS